LGEISGAATASAAATTAAEVRGDSASSVKVREVRNAPVFTPATKTAIIVRNKHAQRLSRDERIASMAEGYALFWCLLFYIAVKRQEDNAAVSGSQ
jgi:hypothetical protein